MKLKPGVVDIVINILGFCKKISQLFMKPKVRSSSRPNGRVGEGAKKHEIYVAAFGSHLFYDRLWTGLVLPWLPWSQWIRYWVAQYSTLSASIAKPSKTGNRVYSSARGIYTIGSPILCFCDAISMPNIKSPPQPGINLSNTCQYYCHWDLEQTIDDRNK